jgi:hypothetical protein
MRRRNFIVSAVERREDGKTGGREEKNTGTLEHWNTETIEQ